jgi:hypothetical protein
MVPTPPPMITVSAVVIRPTISDDRAPWMVRE